MNRQENGIPLLHIQTLLVLSNYDSRLRGKDVETIFTSQNITVTENLFA